jgi:hypothetical protein
MLTNFSMRFISLQINKDCGELAKYDFVTVDSYDLAA